ncbi:MAG: enoyl-CoA hydratase-related protein [Deltaproteobacteria bacterium]|jgi:naphthoate synthase
MAYTDISYRVAESTAWITIERPEVKNAFRPETVDELVAAFHAAWRDRTVAVAVLSGANDTFCSGGDQSGRDVHGYGDRPGIGLDMAGLHGALRGIPKPVIAMVDGFAIGGAPRLHPLPPLTPPTHCPAITCAAASGEAPPCTICMKARVIPAGSRCWMMLRP